ncbi:hypothetical protein CIG75_02735 [Tumebacillus algifaecis]|uniref:DUF4097 domain-containing protein n=1 Tax=Tumebacillus algifaecis TaxID=1214604 RepID=A0A223CXH6_9BACL|nr:DUF4097 family beta strand repeat-containing protein [Tumebacillus algifaecis]ASS74001.1 hypothetical protein CIG75_02735 [Tumebacillus algifaecis]
MKLRTISIYAAIALAIGVTGTGVLYSMGVGTPFFAWNSETTMYTNDDKTIEAADITSIDLQFPAADIAFKRSEDAQIHVVLRSNLNDEQLGKRYDYTAEQDGAKLAVKLEGKPSIFGFQNGNENIHIDILLPKQTLDAVNVQYAAGDVKFESLQAKQLRVDTSAGDIAIKDYQGSELEVSTKFGAVKLDTITVDRTKVEIAAGSVKVNGLTGETFEAESSSGNLTLADVAAQVKARVSSGNAEVQMKELRHNLDISVTAGNVNLKVPKSASFAYDLSAKAGNLKNNLSDSTTTSGEKRNQSGTIGSGGPEVRVSTMAGNITVSAE